MESRDGRGGRNTLVNAAMWEGDRRARGRNAPTNAAKGEGVRGANRGKRGICFQFEKHGTCRYGDDCKFEHVGQVAHVNATANSCRM